MDGYYGQLLLGRYGRCKKYQMVEVSELLKPDDSCSLLLAVIFQSVSHPNLPKPVLTINRLK